MKPSLRSERSAKLTAVFTAVSFFLAPVCGYSAQPILPAEENPAAFTTVGSSVDVSSAVEGDSPFPDSSDQFLSSTLSLEPLSSGEFDSLPAAQPTSDPVRDFSYKQPTAGAYMPCAGEEIPCTSGALPTLTEFVQDSHDHIRFGFDLSQGEDGKRFAGTVLDFSHAPVAAGFVIGFKASNAAGGRLKIRFTDILDRVVTVGVDGITGAYQNYKITGQLLYDAPGAFDASQIKTLHIYVDDDTANSALASGAIDIRTRGLAFLPQAQTTSDKVRDFTSKQPVVGAAEPCANAAESPCTQTLDTVTSLTQDARNHFSFNFALGAGVPGSRFAGASLDFSHDPVAAGFVLGLKASASSGGKLKLMFEDQNHKKVTVLASNVPSGAFQNFKVTGDLLYSAGIAGFNAKKIIRITILADEFTAGDPDASGGVEVFSEGLKYAPLLAGSDYLPAAVTQLAGAPVLEAWGGSQVHGEPAGNFYLEQLSSSEFELEYDLSAGDTGFVLADIRRGSFNPDGSYTGPTLSLPETLILAARGHSGTRVKVEITDTQLKTAEIYLDLAPAYQNFTLSLAADQLPKGFKRSKVARIRFLFDPAGAGEIERDLVKIRIGGMAYAEETFPAESQAVRSELIARSFDYFQQGIGIDPVTHLPYDNVDENGNAAKFTQPTLIGFYLQMLSDVMNDRAAGPQGTMTGAQAAQEAGLVLDSLLQMQQDFGWNNLLPFLSLDPPGRFNLLVGFGDNANLAQSLAAFLGGLENAQLPESEISAAELNAIKADAEQALANMLTGFHAMIDHTDGRYRAGFNLQTFQLQNYMDKLANEFRGAVIFVTALLRTEYGDVPDSVLEGLEPVIRNYADSGGGEIENLAYWDGGAFQAFWPLLRNNERDFVSFRHALYNHLATQADFAAENHLPGFLSASQGPHDIYYPWIGIPEVIENPEFQHLMDLGSAYGLASAFSVDPASVLEWLAAIAGQLPGLMGDFGFFDAARSGSEVVKRYLGIDVASIAMALTGGGSADFDAYLYSRGLALDFNLLYEAVADSFQIQRTLEEIAAPPQFPDRSFSVFSRFAEEGTVGGFTYIPTALSGVRFNYSSLPSAFEGRYWLFNEAYNARNNKLVFQYSIANSPQSILIELKDADDQIVYQTVQTLPAGPVDYQRLEIALPDTIALESVKRLVILINQDGNTDTQGDFTLHAVNFQHF